MFDALVDASTLKPEVIKGLDLMIVRELTAGVYFGTPRGVETLPDGTKRAFDTQVYTTPEIERILRVAFELARKRRNKVTSAEKSNVMESGAYWREVAMRIHRDEFRDVEFENMLADNCSMQLVRNPKQFDVIVTDNLFGDLLSDVAAMTTGSLGMLPSAEPRPGRPGDRPAPRALRAGARLGARHRRQGSRQPDRDARSASRWRCAIPSTCRTRRR